MKNFLKHLVLFFVVSLSLQSCVERIDAGSEGILVNLYGNNKGVDDIAMVTGYVFYNPFTKRVYEAPTYVQTIDYPAFTINAKDGTQFTIDPKLNIRPVAGTTPEIFKKYRKPIDEVMKNTLRTHIENAYKLKLNAYTTDQLLSQREVFEKETESLIKATLLKENFIVDEMTSGLKLPEILVNSINAKNKAVQEAGRIENEVRATEFEARKMIIQAEADKKVYELKQKGLSKEILIEKFLDKWDGELPQYMSDTNGLTLMINGK